MKIACLHRISVCSLLAPAALLAPGALAQTAPEGNPVPVPGLEYNNRPESRWQHVRIGALVGLNINADFRMNGGFGISGSGTPGVYDDGYVRVDNTGDAQGFTSFWGYQDPSQISGSTLTLHRSTGFTTAGDATVDEPYALGLELGYGHNYWRLGRADIGWEFGFGWLPIGITDSRSLGATITRTPFRFDTGGIIPPTAPYNGGPSGEGPVIHDTPTAGSSETIAGTVSGSRKLDVSLFAFKLGPTVYFDLSRSFGVYASAGPALGLVSGDYKFNETLTTSSGATENNGKISANELVYGGYASAMLVYHFPTENADLYLGAQYMPLGSATVSGGGREARLNLGGQINLSAGINWAF